MTKIAARDLTEQTLGATPLGEILYGTQMAPWWWDCRPAVVLTHDLDSSSSPTAKAWLASITPADPNPRRTLYVVPFHVGVALDRAVTPNPTSHAWAVQITHRDDPQRVEQIGDLVAAVEGLDGRLDDACQAWEDTYGNGTDDWVYVDMAATVVGQLARQARTAGVEPGRWAATVAGLLNDSSGRFPDPALTGAVLG